MGQWRCLPKRGVEFRRKTSIRQLVSDFQLLRKRLLIDFGEFYEALFAESSDADSSSSESSLSPAPDPVATNVARKPDLPYQKNGRYVGFQAFITCFRIAC